MQNVISAYVNVALTDYDESMKDHVVELMKESLREESTQYILEDSWEVVENKRKLYRSMNGELELHDERLTEISETREILEVMTVVLTARVI